MTSFLHTLSQWNYQFLPPFTFLGLNGQRFLAAALALTAVLLLSVLATWIVGLLKPEKLVRYGTTMSSITGAAIFFLCVLISTFSRTVPFAPVYIVFGLLLFSLGLLALGTNHWITLRRGGGLAAPYFLHLQSFLWLNLVIHSFVFVPLLLFHAPAYDRAGQTIFWGTPLVLLAIYAVHVALVVPKALDMLGLRLERGDLDQRQRDLIDRFLEGEGREDCSIVVARRGVMNAVAFLSKKKQKIVIGVDLLNNLEEEEVRGILLHEEGHLQDRLLIREMKRMSLLLPLMVLFFSMYLGNDLSGSGLPAFLAMLAAYYLVVRRLRKVRLRGEITADAYVKSQGEEIYRSHLSGLEKIYTMGGIDKDACKRMNAEHLDLDERREALDGGETVLPKRPARRSAVSFVLWLVLGVLVGVLIYNVPLTPSSRWKRAHSRFHTVMYSDSGEAPLREIRKAAAIAEENFGGTSRKLYISLADLTDALLFYDFYEEALEVGTRTVKIGEEIYGDGDLKLVRALKNMGDVHYWEEDYGTAREWFSRALDLQRRLGDEDTEIIDTLESLSWVYGEEQKYQEAADALREVLVLYAGEAEQEYDSVNTTFRLASFLGQAGSTKESDRLLLEGLANAEKNFGAKSETYAEMVFEAGHALCLRGDPEEAERYFERGLEVLGGLADREYLNEETVLQRIAESYDDAGDKGRLMRTYEELLSRREKGKGALDSNDIAELWALAEMHEDLADLEKAGEYYLRVGEIVEMSGEVDRDRRRTIYAKIADALTRTGLAAKAEEFRVRGNEIAGGDRQ